MICVINCYYYLFLCSVIGWLHWTMITLLSETAFYWLVHLPSVMLPTLEPDLFLKLNVIISHVFAVSTNNLSLECMWALTEGGLGCIYHILSFEHNPIYHRKIPSSSAKIYFYQFRLYCITFSVYLKFVKWSFFVNLFQYLAYTRNMANSPVTSWVFLLFLK